MPRLAALAGTPADPATDVKLASTYLLIPEAAPSWFQHRTLPRLPGVYKETLLTGLLQVLKQICALNVGS